MSETEAVARAVERMKTYDHTPGILRSFMVGVQAHYEGIDGVQPEPLTLLSAVIGALKEGEELAARVPDLLAENERLRTELKATLAYWLVESKRSAAEFQRRIERLRTERGVALDALADLARSCGQPEEAVIPSSNSKRRALAALCAAGRLPEGGGHD